MPDRLINTTATIADCIMRGSVYGACLSLLGMPADALLLGAISAGIAHGLRGPTTRRVGWSRIELARCLPVQALLWLLLPWFFLLILVTLQTTFGPLLRRLQQL